MKKTLLILSWLAITAPATAQDPSQSMDQQGNSLHLPLPSIRNDYAVSRSGNPWIPAGPFGGDVVDLAIDPQNPDHLYAAAGLPFVSEDGGENWNMLIGLAGISSNNINSFTALANGTIFATGLYTFGKVFRSNNGGSSWHTRIIPVNSNGRCLATDPNDSSTVYVGLASNISSSSNKVIVRSTDSGNTWIAFDMTSVLPVGWSVINICVDPDDSQTIFAVANTGISDAKIVATFDGGSTWTDRSTNLPAGIPYNAVAIAGQKVFVAGGQLFGSQNMGLWQSTDYGLSWTNISAAFPNKVSNDILVDATDISRMYVATEGDGIYYSTDAGITWNFDATGAGTTGAARCLAIKPGEPDHLYAGFLSLALCKSTDAGLNWEYANNGIATLQVEDIEISPLDPEKVFVAFEAENSGGCYISTNGGAEWELVAGLPGTRFSQVTFGSDGTMYTWSNGPSTVAQEGLYKSTDGGTVWTNMGPNVGSLFETQIFALAASKTDPDLVFIGGNNFGVNGWASVIYKTTDGGLTWVNTYSGPASDYYSIRFISIDQISNDEIIYAGYKSEVQGGFLKSTDGGDTWVEIGSTIPKTFKWGGAIVCRTDDPELLIAGCGGYGYSGSIFLSADGGVSWTSSNLNLGTYSKITDILLHPTDPEVMYCASTQNGVYLSENGGVTWTVASDGLTATNITGFSNPFPSDTGFSCYASSFTNSTFRTQLITSIVGVKDKNPEPAVVIYPNPCEGWFSLLSSDNSKVQGLEVLNMTGCRLLMVEKKDLDVITPQIRVDLDPGVYLVRIRMEEKTVTEKLMIRKEY